MAFHGCEFLYDDVSCFEYGLMIYDFGSNSQDDVSFQTGKVIEDRLVSRYDSLMYGITNNEPLEYTLIFGANVNSLDAVQSLDRYEIEAISSWLTGHGARKWLTITQWDMTPFRYKCTISELKLITYGSMPWAFSCKVSCDSPFAYTFPEEFKYTVSGNLDVNLFNRSSYNGWYKPKIELTLPGSTEFSIVNNSDSVRKFAFSDLPIDGTTINVNIDNRNQIITNDLGLNLYPYFNMNFFRMKRGDNLLRISGYGTIKIICEFPVNIGG